MTGAQPLERVGADRRCAWCEACVARGFGVVGIYEGRRLYFHEWCFLNATTVCDPRALELDTDDE